MQKAVHREESIYKDETILGLILKQIKLLREARDEDLMHIKEYNEIESNLQTFFIELIDKCKNDEENAILLKLKKDFWKKNTDDSDKGRHHNAT